MLKRPHFCPATIQFFEAPVPADCGLDTLLNARHESLPATRPIPHSPDAAKAASSWPRAGRKFHEAAESAPQHAGWVLLQIQHLYRIEKQLRETRAGPRQRQARRASESQKKRKKMPGIQYCDNLQKPLLFRP
jgi:hypothetical protein